MFVMAVASAAAPAFTPAPARADAPAFLPVNHQAVTPLTRAEVWARLHDFLQDQGFTVTSEDAVGGLLNARRTTPGKAGLNHLAVCGSHLFWRSLQARIDLTILVRPAEGGTKVDVNAAFLDLGRPGKAGVPSYGCTSTGALEAAILSVASGQPMEAAVIPR